MKIELRKLSEIKPYEKNPRLNDDAVEAVAASIREFGFRQPIVVDTDGVIIVGHTRYKAALKLGLEKAPVHVNDLHATMLHLLGIDHERLTYRFQGRYFRLTDIGGKVLRELLV